MNNFKRSWFASSVIAIFLGFAMTTTLVGCGGGEDDDGSSYGSESGGSRAGGSDTGGASSSGGEASTGGEVGDGPFVGDACSDDSECPMLGEFAGFCRTNWPAGYCTGTCNRSEDCGPGNVCNRGLTTCLKACDDDSECREGYRCNDNFGGCDPVL